MSEFSLVTFAKENPIPEVSQDVYMQFLEETSRFLEKDHFKMFLASFVHFLNNKDSDDFVVDFDQVVKWCGFVQKAHAKRHLLKILKENVDYIITYPNMVSESTLPKRRAAPTGATGKNKEKIMLNVDAFKKFCLTANAKNSQRVIEYFLRIEKNHFKMLRSQMITLTQNKQQQIRDREEDLLFAHRNDKLVYLGMVEPDVVKFGYSNGNVYERVVYSHKNSFDSFDLKYIIPTENCVELERKIKEEFRDRIIKKSYGGNTHTELIKLRPPKFGVADLYKQVIELDREIKRDNSEESARAFKIMYLENKSLKDELKQVKRGWSLLKNDLDKHEYDYESFEGFFEKNCDPVKKKKYFLEFLENLYSENADTEKFFRNSEIYESYRLYVANFSDTYSYSSRKFSIELFAFSDIRKTTKKISVPDSEEKVRFAGKKIHFSDKFLRDIITSRHNNK